MSATITAYEDAMHEVFTQERLEKQLYTGTLLLDSIEKTDRFTIGLKAVVPQHTGRNGGYTALPASGGALNTAGEQGINRVEYDLTHHYLPIEIESATLDQTEGNAKSAAAALETEVSGALDDIRRHFQRQLVMDGSGLIAKCTTTSSSTTVELDPAGDGFDAIERGWLGEGSQIVIGTTSNPTSVATVREITAVDENTAAPSIDISGSAVSTTGSNYISWASSRSGSTSREMNGLDGLTDASATFGLDPSTYGFWKPAGEDTTTTDISIEAMMWGGRRVHQKTGKTPGLTVMGLEQRDEFYSQLQLQVNFAGDKAIGAGDREGIKWAGQSIFEEPDMLTRNVFFLSPEHLFLCGARKGPYWQNEHTGGKILEWKQGYTSFVATLIDRRQLCTRRRNAHAALRSLSRPSS